VTGCGDSEFFSNKRTNTIMGINRKFWYILKQIFNICCNVLILYMEPGHGSKDLFKGSPCGYIEPCPSSHTMSPVSNTFPMGHLFLFTVMAYILYLL